MVQCGVGKKFVQGQADHTRKGDTAMMRKATTNRYMGLLFGGRRQQSKSMDETLIVPKQMGFFARLARGSGLIITLMPRPMSLG